MKYERIIVKSSCKACSGKIAFKLDGSISKDNILPLLVINGFNELKNFTKAGILYAESNELIVSGTFGQNMIQTSCKKGTCETALNSLGDLLTTME